MKGKKVFLLVLISFIFLLITSNSQANVIDFESVSLGSYNSIAFAGVIFSALPDLESSAQLLVRDFSSFGYGHVLSTIPSDMQIIVAKFLTPINYLQIDNPLHGPGEVDVITASAYDSLNNLLGTVTQNPGDQFLTLNFNNISRVLFNDVGGNWGNGYVIDNVTFNTAVPEPSTLFLLGFGLIGLAGFGRKKFFKNK